MEMASIFAGLFVCAFVYVIKENLIGTTEEDLENY